MFYRLTGFGLILVLFILLACVSRATPLALKVEKAPEALSPVTAKEGWEMEWERTLALARKEGKLTLYASASLGTDTRTALVKILKEKMGIDLEITPGRPPEVVQKIMAERRAGLFIPDVYMTGPTTAWGFLKPIGALESPEKYLLLPEVMDPQIWWGGQLLWMDKERTFLQFILAPSNTNFKNIELVRPGEITSYKDLLAPKWKGKILLGDPLIGSSAGLTLFYMAEYAMGWDYIRALAKQEPLILQDGRQMVEWTARGKYPMSFGSGQTDFAVQLMEMGLPIEVILLKEGNYLSQAMGAFTILNKAPHPNAIKVFINWLLTREGQTMFSRAETKQSARLDVPTDHLSLWQIRQSTDVNLSTEESHIRRLETREPLARILGIIK